MKAPVVNFDILDATRFSAAGTETSTLNVDSDGSADNSRSRRYANSKLSTTVREPHRHAMSSWQMLSYLVKSSTSHDQNREWTPSPTLSVEKANVGVHASRSMFASSAVSDDHLSLHVVEPRFLETSRPICRVTAYNLGGRSSI